MRRFKVQVVDTESGEVVHEENQPVFIWRKPRSRNGRLTVPIVHIAPGQHEWQRTACGRYTAEDVEGVVVSVTPPEGQFWLCRHCNWYGQHSSYGDLVTWPLSQNEKQQSNENG